MLVKSGISPSDTQNRLKGTTASVKNELLFTQFGINYNLLPEIFKKGTSLFREEKIEEVKSDVNLKIIRRSRWKVVVFHGDIIQDSFWSSHEYILSGTKEKKKMWLLDLFLNGKFCALKSLLVLALRGPIVRKGIHSWETAKTRYNKNKSGIKFVNR